MSLPENAEKVEVTGATVPFHKYEEGGITYFQFDTSMTGPPEPMINAMCGLGCLTGENTKLIMINHKYPGGLFSKIDDKFDHVVEELPNGNVKLTFSYKVGISDKADLSARSCDG